MKVGGKITREGGGIHTKGLGVVQLGSLGSI